MQVNHELSKQLAGEVAKINLQKRALDTDIEAKRGWRNAYRAALYLPHLAGAARYIEGWAVGLDAGEPFEHAWLEQGGEILDPTYWEKGLAYFPGLRFTMGAAYRVKIKTAGASGDELPFAWRIDSEEGLGIPAYRQAYEDAVTFATSQM